MEKPQSSEKKQPGLLWRVVDVCVYAWVYISLEYIVSSCRFGFRAEPVCVFFDTLNLFLFFSYWKYLQGACSKKWLRVLIVALSIAIYLAIVYLFGFLDVAPAMKRLS